MKATDADLVVGSRYGEKNLISDWPKHRLIISKLANVYINFFLGLRLSDYTNGYRLYNRKAVELLVNKEYITSDFILLSESAYTLHKAGLNIAEVPIHFKDREKGESTFGSKKLTSALVDILRIRFNK